MQKYKNSVAVSFFIYKDLKADIDKHYQEKYYTLKKNEFLNILLRKGLETIKKEEQNG